MTSNVIKMLEIYWSLDNDYYKKLYDELLKLSELKKKTIVIDKLI